MKREAITQHHLDTFKRLHKETGAGPMALLRGRRDIPAGLTSNTIWSWFNGRAKTARSGHIAYVLRCWKDMPPLVQITPEISKTLQSELTRAGLSQRAVIGMITPPLENLSAKTLSRWVNGYTKTARQDHFEAVIAALRGAPDAPRTPDKPATKTDRRTKFQTRLEFTEQHRAALENERIRTGVDATPLLKDFNQGEVPDGLSASMISSWLNNKPKTVAAELYDWTLAAWKALPNQKE